MSVEVWAIRWTRPLSGEEAAALTKLLPPARSTRLIQQRTPEKRQEVLCAYGLLLLALRRRQGWTVFPEIVLDAGGKPRFPDHPGVEFSISHTAGAALAALSDRPVGADIERIRPLRPETMRRIAGTEDLDAFFRCWVRREARSKCSGKGVGTMLRTEPPLETGEFYWEWNAFPGYAAGMAYRSPGPVKKTQLSLEDLTEGLL